MNEDPGLLTVLNLIEALLICSGNCCLLDHFNPKNSRHFKSTSMGPSSVWLSLESQFSIEDRRLHWITRPNDHRFLYRNRLESKLPGACVNEMRMIAGNLCETGECTTWHAGRRLPTCLVGIWRWTLNFSLEHRLHWESCWTLLPCVNSGDQYV